MSLTALVWCFWIAVAINIVTIVIIGSFISDARMELDQHEDRISDIESLDQCLGKVESKLNKIAKDLSKDV
jgi:hypothetical protein